MYFKSTHNIARKIDTKVLKTSKREKIYEKLLELKIAQDKDIWNTVFVDQGMKGIGFSKKGQLDFKYLIASVNYQYKNCGKHFKLLYIYNDDIESIEENDFDGIRFDEIQIKCPNLKRIHWNAFGQQAQYIKKFECRYSRKLTTKQNSNYDLFKLINSLVGCEEINMESFGNELQPINLNNLKRLKLNGGSLYKITSICSYAFYECNQIELIDLSNNEISCIGENAFNFRCENDKKLTIYLEYNQLNESCFALNSLSNFKRPTELSLTENDIYYLEEKVFKPFFDENQLNEVSVSIRSGFQINNAGNRWNQIEPKYILAVILPDSGLMCEYIDEM